MNRRIRCAAIALITAACLVASATPALAQSAAGLEAFVGTWTINPAKSKLGRAGPGGAQTQRSNTFTWVFVPDGPGLRMNIYAEFPAPAPSTTLSVVANGKPRPCEMQKSCLGRAGDPREQSYTFTRVNPSTLVRVFHTRGEVVEYNVYALAKDGKTLAATSWSPETPEYQNVQVFDRQP